ncbi:chaperonin 10-like protein [Powellomyces hirtus]|nr:chaperonin 10-like protein [Powellomyces hirtus]
MAVHITKFGSVEGLELAQAQKPGNPAAGQVVVNMKIRPVNPSDCLTIQGTYAGFKPERLPAVPGLEGMGVVTAIGSGVTRAKVGQRVVPLMLKYAEKGSGTWQEYVTIDQADLVVVPDDISDEYAAQLVVNPLTIIGMLKRLPVPAGAYLVQNAAGSTLACQLIKVCKHRGIKTANIVRRAAQVKDVEAAGGDVVVASEDKTPEQTAEAVKKAIAENSGNQYTAAYAGLDAVGGNGTLTITLAVKDGAKVVNYGALESLRQTISIFLRDVTVDAYWVSTDVVATHLETFYKWCEEVFDLMRKGVMVPDIGRKYPLSEVKTAVQESLKPGRRGKFFLTSY